MPLYECEQCGKVDNTALTNFWWDVMREKKPQLCSECDPAIGKWHDMFPKSSATEYAAKFGPDSIQFPVTKPKEKV
jgi:hypothetical protein